MIGALTRVRDSAVTALSREASTRSVSLLRILMALLMWSRWANEVTPHRNITPERLLLSAAFFTTTFWMLIGWRSRLGTLAAGLVSAVMIFVMDAGWYSHHTRVICLGVLLLVLTPCGGSYSVDRWLSLRRSEAKGQPPGPEIGPSWGRIPIGILVGAVYFWSGVDKLGGPFLSGDRLEQMFMYTFLGSDFPESTLFAVIMRIGAVGVTGAWLVMPFALFHKRAQKYFMPLGFLLHSMIYLSFPVGPFTVTMWALYLAFLDPDAFHRFIDRMHGYVPAKA